MKREVITILLFTAMSIAFITPAAIQAQSSAMQQSGSAESTQMVSAHVALRQNVDASKFKPGDEIRTTLTGKVHLKNGTELPSGTVIVGVVAEDDMQVSGTSKLALNFSKAELKNGTTIPLKATIVGVYPPETQDSEGNPLAPGDQEAETWTNHTDSVDQIGALPGVDLHSNVASHESGVLVSTSKHDVKLKWGSEIALAVAAQSTVGE